ncbi:MAG TPA: AraC family transcriptional regulator [Clostridia bacterium]|nr:AraC family transcriptional regulator [Clostridia bacterium]
MEGQFTSLTKQIPEAVHSKISLSMTENMMLVKSHTYISGVELYNIDYSFSFPVSDPPSTIIGNKEYNFHRGRIIMFPPDTKVSIKESVPTPEYITLFFKQEYLKDILSQMDCKKQLSFRYNEYSTTPRLCTAIHSLDEEMSVSEGHKCNLMQQSMTTQIAIELLRQTGACDGMDRSEPKLPAHYVKDAIEYINANFNSDIKIEDISSYTNLSPYYLIRIFKESTGQTPHEFLLRIRLEHAQKLLKSNLYSINEAAMECGFVNPSHFTACFKQIYGVPPTIYRKNHNT